MTFFVKDLAERAGKTFAQAYLTLWMLRAGFTDSGVEHNNADAFDLLVTWDNVKAGVVGVALSIATSFASKPIGRNSASLVD